MSTRIPSFGISLAFFFMLAFWSTTIICRQIPELSMLDRHEQWMAYHGKVYKDAEDKLMRYNVFKNNVERIETFNKKDNLTFKLAVNKFADLTNEEFRTNLLGGYRRSASSQRLATSEEAFLASLDLSAMPATMDWRKKGAVNPVKDQGQCGCCWAFSAVAAMEGILQIKRGKLLSLSEQELVDCDVKGEDQGCGGGLMDNAFQFIMSNGGLSLEASYPYEAKDGTCKTIKASKPAATITGYKDVPANSEKALLAAVASQPVSIAVDGGAFEFQFYSSGVLTGECSTYLNHAITAIGYGVASDGTKYWLMKNSWGTGWGDGGYIKMQRDYSSKTGICGIAMEPSYPTA